MSSGAGVTGQPGSASIEQPDYWWYRARSHLLESALAKYVGTPDRVLDVGSADGPSVQWMFGDYERVALDVDLRGLQPGKGVCASAMALPFRDSSFDVVSAFDVIEHCEPEAAALQEIARVLRPGGRLLASVPAYQWAWTDHDVQAGHYRRYTRPRLLNALQAAGFQVERCTYGFAGVFPFFAAERLKRRISATQAEGLPQVSPTADRILTGLSRWEARWLRTRNVGYGSSVFVAATKPAA
jgi:SAM-dependent methyltransferase